LNKENGRDYREKKEDSTIGKSAENARENSRENRWKTGGKEEKTDGEVLKTG